MILLSGIYFQGAWQSPFNVSDTLTEDFYDELDNKIARVPMMHQKGKFPLKNWEYANFKN
jgi:serine protease inhibitor